MASGAGFEPTPPEAVIPARHHNASRSCVLPCGRGAIQLFWRPREKENSKNLGTIAIWDAAYYATRLRGINIGQAPLPCT